MSLSVLGAMFVAFDPRKASRGKGRPTARKEHFELGSLWRTLLRRMACPLPNTRAPV